MTTSDLAKRVRELEGQGISVPQIARMLGVTERRVDWVLEHIDEFSPEKLAEAASSPTPTPTVLVICDSCTWSRRVLPEKGEALLAGHRVEAHPIVTPDSVPAIVPPGGLESAGFETFERPKKGGARTKSPCGTLNAYKRHVRNSEPVDAECARFREISPSTAAKEIADRLRRGSEIPPGERAMPAPPLPGLRGRNPFLAPRPTIAAPAPDPRRPAAPAAKRSFVVASPAGWGMSAEFATVTAGGVRLISRETAERLVAAGDDVHVRFVTAWQSTEAS